ncbi:phosphatase PAP2 family protein [Segeticoccus rhizosphaerae]|uniref:phosphatase PAP2 family protein n=1 Tax=Segeticoccus rhizosphaerae TaxID=1104777 RepID=UPI00138FB891|nr:phosphatase PAP2 family protein [Ornithinicoccus soli]
MDPAGEPPRTLRGEAPQPLRPAQGGRRQGRGRLVGEAALAGLVALALFVVTAYVALRTYEGQRVDREAMFAVSGPQDTVQNAHEVLNTVSVGTVALVVLGCMVLALARRRWALSIAALVLVAGANLSTQLLKHELLSRTDFGLGTLNGLPSGHTTVVVSLALAALLVSPTWLRTPVTLVGACAATLIGVGTVVARWHRPSDVVAAVAVCVVWAAVALLIAAAAGHGYRRRLARRGQGHWVALLGALTVGVLVVFAGIRPSGSPGSLDLVVGALSLIGLACALAVGWMSHVARHLD